MWETCLLVSAVLIIFLNYNTYNNLTKHIFYFNKVRNAGNIIPHSQHFQDEYFSCEPAALELGCVINGIRHIIVCGHSDCKAMNLLYTLRDPDLASLVS